METSENTNLQNPKPTTPFHYHLEEALSLRDLPLNTENTNSTATTTTTTEDQRKRSIELFEFLTSTSNDCSPAENIIFGGKIIPLNYQNAILSSPEYIRPRISTRSEPLSTIQGNKLNRPVARDNARPMRISRSLDHRNLSRGSTTARGNASPTKRSSPSPSWRFLNALSCKEPTSVAATTPLWFPHV
ncbi:hypothetical protein HID58_000677 [Brassica napus]|uniref:Uncharacterized protein n=1 Tax=Brassica napus TaxID=3708 RepID=A0ABQ8EHH1_BRANA|nr:hypothetical protein HID58_000677 [Brassica napus]